MERKINTGGVALHVVFWAVIIFLCVLSTYKSEEAISAYSIIVYFGYYGIINLILFYVNYQALIPYFILEKQKTWVYIASLILLSAVIILIKFAVALLNREIVLEYVKNKKHHTISYSSFIINSVFVTGFLVVISSLLRFTIDSFIHRRNQRNLESEKKEMELAFLKSQLNPHFLFNSLNNIYSLAYQKSDQTADAILKLSDIMRYMIYESNDEKVSLSKELEYLNNYIALQNLRFKEGVFVSVNSEGVIGHQKIVPLILISFIENAFKHGVANDSKNPIKINIIANTEILHFSISNKKNNQNKDGIGGVGLNNVDRRLEIMYPERYQLNVVNSPTHYTTELILQL
ncbi:MAG: sensor histidine kinase [Sphingobacteriaceae bacterium]|nr:sensor histidine kinase [Sphingobacteriaceae bacterium]